MQRKGLASSLAVGQINYKQLRKISPEAARKAVLDHLQANSFNISKTATTFGITRAVVYDIISRNETGTLKDRPRVPKNQPKRTPKEVEDKVMQVRNETQLSPSKLSSYLEQAEGMRVPPGTIRNIIRRQRENERLISIHLCD